MAPKSTYKELEVEILKLHSKVESLNNTELSKKLVETEMLLKVSIESGEGIISLSIDTNYNITYTITIPTSRL